MGVSEFISLFLLSFWIKVSKFVFSSLRTMGT